MTLEAGGDVVSIDEARDQMLVHVEQIQQLVGLEWENSDATGSTSCSLPGTKGEQREARRTGRIEGLSSDAARVVAEYLETAGFDARIRENQPDQWDVIASAEDGLDLQFRSGDDNYAFINAQSVCVPIAEGRDAGFGDYLTSITPRRPLLGVRDPA